MLIDSINICFYLGTGHIRHNSHPQRTSHGKYLRSKIIFLGKEDAVVNFMCPLDWVSLGMCVRVFLAKISIWNSRISKADCPPQCGWPSSNPLISWIEQNGGGRRALIILLLDCLLELGHQSSPVLVLGFTLLALLVPRPCPVWKGQIVGLLSLIIIWANL